MSSRFSAARPKRAGEAFARSHHGEKEDLDDDGAPSKKVKFDVRNPSALVADEREEDDILDADVIGTKGGTATKRGAVNIDGYDSDSDHETFDARAEANSKDDAVNILDKLDNYDSRLKGGAAKAADDDDDDDMFGADEKPRPSKDAASKSGRKSKEVHFMDNDNIQGQVEDSKSGGRIHINSEEESSDDEEDIELSKQEEDVDEEVGAGGLKRHAPKIDAFNMKSEQEEGAFDSEGNFIRKAADADALHDRWLDGIRKKDMKKAAEAHERREAELRQQRKEEDSIMTSDLIGKLILNLEKGENPLEALARLGRIRTKTGVKTKRIPKWKLKKQNGGADAMEVDKEPEAEDLAQTRVKEAINAITEAADRLLGRDYPEIYETEREMLVREYRKETGEEWVEPAEAGGDTDATDKIAIDAADQWEFRWTDGRDEGAKQGPFDTAMMKAWHDAGYFGEGVEFRRVGEEEWTRAPSFI
ncbi:hypothetical protein MCOR27_008858 [Pyricularia oryzae]|uniref:GYF domain-containing protein n=2 Tax=Pyricularia TaxID=48558 RepID=A0ABQ8N2Z7_PYRGI|nr:hypothetical protein MCOR01_004552 [Pyricularia oryzae]KAI6290391.1 hypothetical protein MCOR33_011330 [Pyricularia grisea]KAH9431240.1 hypothetical protein MCOR02_008542 [Pyricularia oryzae]KAI6256304.1 hypothetical protein MCOR19_007247 [Pyricularia oryzae]KAI6271404.1 hypothetical protein MCOR27_008858 [Pyricularia oryzae]